MKNSISKNVNGKLISDIRLKLGIGIGVGLIAVGIGYLGWHSWSHESSIEPVYDVFPEWLLSEEEVQSTPKVIKEQVGVETVELSIENPEYSLSDMRLTNVFTGVSVGTEYADAIGKQESQFCISYDAVLDSEEGWSEEPIVFTAKNSDETYRMHTKMLVGDEWVDVTNGSVEMEQGVTYSCVAYCDAMDELDDLSVYAMDTDYKTTKIVLK